MTHFQLSATLEGHELDVRSVAAVDVSVASASRDGTARIWTPANNDSYVSPLPAHNVVAYAAPSFVNAVAFAPKLGLVAAAGQEGIVYLFPPTESAAKPTDDVGQFQLVGHAANVCSLTVADNLLASSSWDSTAKIWDLSSMELKFDLVGHQATVWDVKIIDDNTFLTCSADRTIRKWVGNTEVARFSAGHSDVIRKLAVLDSNTYASASNDGTVLVWDCDGNVLATLVGHDSFVYDLTVLLNGDLVSCGEDRSIRVWRNYSCIQAITLPCISVWCVAALANGDIVAGGSDNLLRVFSRSSERTALDYQLTQFTEQVQASAISEQSVDNLNRTDIPSYDALQNPGKSEGATIMVKSPAGVIEAHQWSGGEWVKIGDVVGSAGNSGSKTEYNGASYDYVFDVDVEDGKPPLKLPYNANENPYAAAERFLAQNELPNSYLQEVVQFIEKNTEGVKLDLTAPVENPYADSTQRAAAPKSVILPQKTYISFKEYKPEQLIKGLEKLNGELENSFSPAEVSQISYNLLDINSKRALELVTVYLPKIFGSWAPSLKLIGYDILRVCIPRITTVDLISSTDAAELILKYVNEGLNIEAVDSNLTSFLMILKTLNNLVSNTLFLQLYITVDDANNLSYNEFFDELVTKIKSLTLGFASSSSKHFNTSMTTLASLVYNLLVFPFKNSSFKSGSKPVITLANAVASTIIKSNNEAAYRLSIAFGNFLYSKEISVLPPWWDQVKSVYGNEKRFVDLLEDISKI